MYNLRNLNDYEFEVLCKDIMQKKLNTELRVYKKGRDGGIDIRAICGRDIVIQVKHYINSSFSDLKGSLKKEIDKVKKIETSQYYICTSRDLTEANIKEIYTMFEDYMENEGYIIDGTRINEFLEKEENKDIVKKNYKLWLAASNILELINSKDILLDSDELVEEIKRESKLYVKTDSYVEANKILEQKNIIIIQGDPGVGKSTLSKMLILKYISEGYSVKFSSENNLENIKKSIAGDKNKKEIILLDDFLGQHYLEIKSNKPTAIKSLLNRIRNNPNKKIILNTRITILNEAKRSDIKYKALLEDESIDSYLIDLNKMKKSEKAKILYNHIYFNCLPKEYFDNIKEQKKYLKIIDHNNYNPRIIEYVTKKNSYEEVSAKEYFNYIMKKLDNPKDVWHDEFTNRIDKIDRLLMNTLYSLTNKHIEYDILNECFNKRISSLGDIDDTLNSYEIALERLSKSFLKIMLDNEGVKKIGVINPSINDYLSSQIKLNEIELNNILNESIYIEQIIKFFDLQYTRNWVLDNIDTKVQELKVLKLSREYYFIKFIVELDIKNLNIKDIVNTSFFESYKNISSAYEREDYSSIIMKFFEGEFHIFYSLQRDLVDFSKIEYIMYKLPLNNIIEITYFINNMDFNNIFKDELLKEFNYEIQGLIEYRGIDDLKNKYEDIVDEVAWDIVSDFYYEEDDMDEKNDEDNVKTICKEVEESIRQDIETDIDQYNELLQKIPEISEPEWNIDEIIKDIDFKSIVEGCIKVEENDNEDWRFESNNKDDLSIVEDLFERDYEPVNI